MPLASHSFSDQRGLLSPMEFSHNSPYRLIGDDSADTVSGTFTWTIPGGAAEGDLGVIFGGTRNANIDANGPDDDSSWTEVEQYDTSSNEEHFFFIKVLGGSEGSTYTLGTSASTEASGFLVIFRGVDTLASHKRIVVDDDASFASPNFNRGLGLMMFIHSYDTVDWAPVDEPGTTSLIIENNHVHGSGGENPRVAYAHHPIQAERIGFPNQLQFGTWHDTTFNTYSSIITACFV